MRFLRVLVAAPILGAMLAKPSAAQEGRPFQNAWFWGAKGGALVYSSSRGTDNAAAPMVGADWFITRTNGGLYVSFDQSFLTTTAYYREPTVAGDPYVNVKNLRRYSIAAMAYPLQSPSLHPYVGLGVSVHQVGAAALNQQIALAQLNAAAQDSIQAKKVSIAPMIMAGAQKRLPWFSVFAQGTGNFLQRSFLLRNEAPKLKLGWTLEGGIRYNFGSSIDRAR